MNFSKRSAGAANFALSQARRFHSKVILLYIEKPFEGDSFWTGEVARWAKEQMADFLPESAKDPNIRRIVRMYSDVSDGILRVGADAGADLIVMPTYGHGTIRRALLGSVAARVLRDAGCPVWASPHIAPTAPAQWLQPGRILCAIDSGQEDARVLAWASNLASELNSKLCVAWSRKGLTEMPEEMDRLERTHRIYAEAVIEAGNVPDALGRAAARMQVNLLVVGRNFWKSPAEPRLDMYQVVRESPCPVVSL